MLAHVVVRVKVRVGVGGEKSGGLPSLEPWAIDIIIAEATWA